MFLSWAWGRHVEQIGIEVVCDRVVCVCCDCGYRNKYSSMRREEQSKTGWSRKGAEGAAGLK